MPLKCQYCRRTFNNLRSRHNHERNHREHPNVCHVCNLKYADLDALHHHITTKHAGACEDIVNNPKLFDIPPKQLKVEIDNTADNQIAPTHSQIPPTQTQASPADPVENQIPSTSQPAIQLFPEEGDGEFPEETNIVKHKHGWKIFPDQDDNKVTHFYSEWVFPSNFSGKLPKCEFCRKCKPNEFG